MELEDIFTNTSDKGLVFNIYKELTKLNTRKTTQLKNGQKTSIDSSPKRTHRWPIDIWKDAQHHESSQKCKLKPQWDIISHLSEWLSSINQQTTSAGEDVEEGELFCTVGGNADWCRPCGKQYGNTSKKKNGSAFWPSDPTSGNIS